MAKKHKWTKKGVAQCETCGIRRVRAQSTGKFEYRRDGSEDVRKRPGACVPPPPSPDTPEPKEAQETPVAVPEESIRPLPSTGCARCGGKGVLPTDTARSRGSVRWDHPEDWQPCHHCQETAS